MINKARTIIGTLYQLPFVRYVFVGGTTVIIDLALLFLLHGRLKMNLEVATSIAYWTSIIYNFTLNRWWTFSASETSDLRKHAASYLVLLGFNYVFTVISVSLLSHVIFYGAAKIVTIAAQITWTYPIYKRYIFTSKQPNAKLEQANTSA